MSTLTEEKEPSLTTRGLDGENAVRCCESLPTKIELELTGLMSQMIAEALNANTLTSFSSVLAFVAPGRPTVPVVSPDPVAPVTRVPPRVILVPARLLPVGAVIVAGSSVVTAIAQRTASLAVITAASELITEYFKARRNNESSREDCEKCIKRHIWNQTKIQKKMTIEARVRV